MGKLYVKGGILYRKEKIYDREREMNQFVIPKVYREVVLQGILRNTGPPGKTRLCGQRGKGIFGQVWIG